MSVHEYVITVTMSPGKLVRKVSDKCTICNKCTKYIGLVTISKHHKLFHWEPHTRIVKKLYDLFQEEQHNHDVSTTVTHT